MAVITSPMKAQTGGKARVSTVGDYRVECWNKKETD